MYGSSSLEAKYASPPRPLPIPAPDTDSPVVPAVVRSDQHLPPSHSHTIVTFITVIIVQVID